MYQRELLIVMSLVMVIFLGVAGAGWFVVRELHETSKMLVVDTLPGLVDSGLAEERMHDNRHTMHEMLNPHTAAERALMIEQVRTSSTQALWQDYADSIYEPEDRTNYQSMIPVRSNYNQCCEQFFILVSADKMNEATILFSGDLARQFQSYNDAAKKIFAYNVRQGIARGKSIIAALHYGPWAIGGLCVLTFVIGLLLGLRFAMSGGK